MEYGRNKIHVEVVRNIKIVMVKINKVRVFGLFSMLKNFEKREISDIIF